MANPKHVEILKQGVNAWNQWRKENPDIIPDLSDLECLGNEFSETILWRKEKNWWSKVDCGYLDLAGANFAHANLANAILFNANLTGADLNRANLKETGLFGANLTSANLNRAKLGEAQVFGAIFKDADLTLVEFSPRGGSYCAARFEGCYGSERFRRHALHEAFIEEFKYSLDGRVRFLVNVWSVIADCGRTPWRWLCWAVVFCLYYAGIYLGLGVKAFDFDTSLPFNFGSTLYYSIVTFTTLGFGDITPATGLAAFYVTLEVITGYVMLGGLISFIFSKLLPRG